MAMILGGSKQYLHAFAGADFALEDAYQVPHRAAVNRHLIAGRERLAYLHEAVVNHTGFDELYYLFVYGDGAGPEADNVLHAPDEADFVEHRVGVEPREDVPREEGLGHVNRPARELVVPRLSRLRRERLYVPSPQVTLGPTLLLWLGVDDVPVGVVVHNLSHNFPTSEQKTLNCFPARDGFAG